MNSAVAHGNLARNPVGSWLVAEYRKLRALPPIRVHEEERDDQMHVAPAANHGSVKPGQVINEKYWVERVLGRGGMGTVVLATHLQLGNQVALKFLRPSIANDETNYRRFLREARATAQLRSEHVVRVLDIGTTEHDVPFIVMEYLRGHDLDTVVASGPLDISTAVDYGLQIATAVAEAHAAGIVHRDLKPSNIFLARRPDGSALLKVTDFGLAKWTGETRGDLTSSQVILGSPGYMAPEQLRNPRAVDTRADIWSLGAVLYELLAGRRPYQATTLAELVARVLTEPIRPLPSNVPVPLARIIERCLSREPRDRYATVHHLAADLAPFGSTTARDLARRVRHIATARPADGPVPLCAADTLDVAPDGSSRPSPPSDAFPRWARAAIASLGATALVLLVAVVAKYALEEAPMEQPRAEVGIDAASTQSTRPFSPPSIEVIPLAAPEPAPSIIAPPPTVAPSSSPRRRARAAAQRLQQPTPAAKTPAQPSVPLDVDGDGIPDVR